MNINDIDIECNDGMPHVVVMRMSHLFMINYSYLVVDPVSRQSVVVDPAWQIDKIETALRDERSSLNGILLTHAHPDHVHLAIPLAKKYNCPIWMSNEEIADSGFYAQQLIGIDESTLMVGEMLIQPMLTPGHTLGGICYRIANNVFTGDTLFAEGCGICPDIPAAHTLYMSLDQLKKELDPHVRIFPGHSYGKPPGQKFSKLLNENIYLHFKNKDDFAAYRLRKGQSKSAIFSFS